MKEVMERIIESKLQARRKAAALPIEEKLRILDQLREELLVGLAGHRAGAKKRVVQTSQSKKPR